MPCCLYYRLKVSRSFLTQPAPRLETTGTPEGWDASFFNCLPYLIAFALNRLVI